MGIWMITVKDLRLMLKDTGALVTLLALPIVFIAILGISTGKLLTAHDELKLVKVSLVDEDKSELSEHVFVDLSSIPGLQVEKVEDEQEAKRRLQDGSSSITVVLGKDFDKRIDDLEMGDILDLEHGKLAAGMDALDIKVESGAAYVGVADLMQYVVFSAVMHVVSPQVARRNVFYRRALDRMIERHQEEAKSLVARPSPRTTVASTSSIIYQTLIPAFVVLFTYFLVNFMGNSFIQERTLGTLQRIQSSHVGPWQLVCGKTLPFLLISITQSALLFLSGKLLFGMSWGTEPALLIPVILATAVSATGLGLLVATFVRTEAQVASYATFLVVVLAGISGCYMPRDWLPEVMKHVSLATPHAWALIAYKELLTRDSPNVRLIAECCGMLTLFGFVFFTLGSARFRHMEYR